MKRRTFVRTGLLGSLAWGSVGLLPRCRPAAGDNELKERSLAAFRRFREVWDFNDFWKRGNTMDTCVTFALAARQRWPRDPEVKEMLGRGVGRALVADVDGILREAPFLASFGPRHGNDYLAGRGILMRYLGDPTLSSLLPVKMNGTLSRTADAIWLRRDPTTTQFPPEHTTQENDRRYIEQFRRLWGKGDEVYRWDLEKMKEKNRHGVCQAIGLDALGAVIRTEA